MFVQFTYLSADLKRWKIRTFKDRFYAFFEQGIWATVFYRISRCLYLFDVPVLKFFTRLIAFFLMKLSEYFLGVNIKPEAEIGPGLYIGHVGMIIIHHKAKIGKNLSIGPGVIIGQKGLGAKGIPVIGDDVYIGTGAKVLGAVRLGNSAKVGANAVVLKDVPEGATAVGVPAKIINNEVET